MDPIEIFKISVFIQKNQKKIEIVLVLAEIDEAWNSINHKHLWITEGQFGEMPYLKNHRRLSVSLIIILIRRVP